MSLHNDGNLKPYPYESCCCSITPSCPSLCNPMHFSMSGFSCPSLSPRVCSNSCPLTHVMLSNHHILCIPLFLLPSVFASVRVFSSESSCCIKWPKIWSFSFNISSSNEFSGLISFSIELFDILVV